jgi:hypothetical protein
MASNFGITGPRRIERLSRKRREGHKAFFHTGVQGAEQLHDQVRELNKVMM